MEGFIVLHRKLLEWEWADDPLTGWLWVHLLLRASTRDKKWRQMIIKRGQLVTSIESLSLQTGLSEWQVRTRLSDLEECGCIHKQTTNKFTLVTICNYNTYQDVPNDNDSKATSKPQTNHKQTTNKPQHLNNINKETSKEINVVVDDNTRTREVSEVFIDSKINSWKNADIVSQDNIPELNPKWIEDIKLLVRRFNEKEITAEEVYGYYEDFKA